jgi:hypothetical protein
VSEVFNKVVKKGLETLGEIPSPVEIGRKLGLNIPSEEDLTTLIQTVAEGVSPGTDIREMIEGSEKISKGNVVSGGLQTIGGLAGVAIPFSKQIKGLARDVGARLESIQSNQPLKLRQFAAEQVKQLKPEEAVKIIGEGKKGLPLLLYHTTKATKPFKKFKWGKQGEEASKARTEGLQIQPGGIVGGTPDYNDFMSTTLNPRSPYTTSYQVDNKSRTLIGIGKVNKLFNFTNKKHVDSIIKPLEKKDLKNLEKSFSKNKKELEEKLKEFSEDLKPGGSYSKNNIPLPSKEFIKDYKNSLRKKIKELNLNKSKKEVQDRWKSVRNEMEKGQWKVIENENIKDQIRKLGYDAFTTQEAGTNVMLFNPDKQFIPLFDPLKKNVIGFSTGGGLSSLNEKV